MAAPLLTSNQPPLRNSLATGVEPEALPQFSPLGFSTQHDYHAYLHNTLLSNLPYYTALARYRQRKRDVLAYRDGRQYKNLRMYFRITQSGLCLLRTQYAKKPKSPV